MADENQNQNQQCERADYKVQIIRVALAPITKIFQNEVCFILIVIMGLAGWSVYWGVCKIEKFADEKIPLHIEAINKGNADVAKQFGNDLKDQREHYVKLRESDERNIDRIERLATGKKTASALSTKGEE